MNKKWIGQKNSKKVAEVYLYTYLCKRRFVVRMLKNRLAYM